jgi:hypothetical protein
VTGAVQQNLDGGLHSGVIVNDQDSCHSQPSVSTILKFAIL